MVLKLTEEQMDANKKKLHDASLGMYLVLLHTKAYLEKLEQPPQDLLKLVTKAVNLAALGSK